MDFDIIERYQTMLRYSEDIALTGYIDNYEGLGIIGELHYGLTDFFLKYNSIFSDADKEILLQRLGQYDTMILTKFAENFFYPLFYIYKKYDQGDQGYMQEIIHSMHYFIATRGVLRYNYIVGKRLNEISPIWGNFFNHLKYPIKTFPRIIADNREEAKGLISYCLLNLIDTLIEMDTYILKSEIYNGKLKDFWEKNIPVAIHKVEDMIGKLDDSFLRIYIEDDLLQHFLSYLIAKWKSRGYSNKTLDSYCKEYMLSIKEIEKLDLGWRQKCWAILNNLFIDNDLEAHNILEITKSYQTFGDRRSDHLTFLVELFGRKKLDRNCPNNLLPIVESIDTKNILRLIFEKIEYIANVDISSIEEKKVMKMRDQELRPILCRIITQSKNIDPTEKGKIKAEDRKPHARGEISDIDFKLLSSRDSIFVGIHIKSGVEIREDRVSERYISQLIRPLSIFGSRRAFSCLVSPKPLSLEFARMINSLQINLGLPIDSITGQDFIKLLKVYNEI